MTTPVVTLPLARGELELVLEHPGRETVARRVVRGDSLTIGRSADCDLSVDDPALSRKHVRVEVCATELLVTDCSTNGTLADGNVLHHSSGRVALERPIAIGSCTLHLRKKPASAPIVSATSPHGPRASAPSPGATLPPAPPPRAAKPAPQDAGAPIELRREVHRMLLEHLDLNAIDPTRNDDPALRPRVLAALRRIARMLDTRLPPGVSQDSLVGEVADEALGLGPLERLLADPTVTEIMVVDAHHIFVERSGKLSLSGARFTDEERVRAAVERIVTPLGRRIDESSPLVDARLPDGSRVNVVIRPLALRGSCITIRKFARTPITLEKLLALDALSPTMAAFLVHSVRAKKNIVISGGTGSGKTTLLNVLSAAIPEDERIVTIEDAAELQLVQPHVVSLESRPANMEGRGDVTIRELVKNALRMRPDRIVVGECRGGEALDMLQAMNTGHDGSLTTTHANSPEEALLRLETLTLMAGIALPVSAIRAQLAKSIHLIVQQTRMPDGARKLSAISETAGIEHDGSLRLRPLFEYVPGTGFEPTGYLPSYLPELVRLGLVRKGESFV
jgi:pilus assembly protein CpaF